MALQIKRKFHLKGCILASNIQFLQTKNIAEKGLVVLKRCIHMVTSASSSMKSSDQIKNIADSVSIPKHHHKSSSDQLFKHISWSPISKKRDPYQYMKQSRKVTQFNPEKPVPVNLSGFKSISLAGCGFMGIYLVGACAYIQDYQPSFLNNVKLGGASAGSLLAACLVCGLPIAQLKQTLLQTTALVRQLYFGAMNPSFDINEPLKESMNHLPDNAHELARGRLFISLTRPKDFGKVVVSDWRSREELIQAIICSCFLPMYSGLKLPVFRGSRYIDGGYSCNLPIPEEPCLTISPFYSKCGICPHDEALLPYFAYSAEHYYGLSGANVVRIKRAFFPPTVAEMENIYSAGYKDATSFIQNL